MPLLDLAHITLTKTFAGISCPVCGGRLDPATVRRNFWARLTRQPPCGSRCYRCAGCRKHFVLKQTSASCF